MNYKIKFEKCSSNANYNKFIGNSNGMFTIESESIFTVKINFFLFNRVVSLSGILSKIKCYID